MWHIYIKGLTRREPCVPCVWESALLRWFSLLIILQIIKIKHYYIYYLSVLYYKSHCRLWAQVYLFANKLKSNLCYQCQSKNWSKSKQHSTDTSSVKHIIEYTLYRCHQTHFHRTNTTPPTSTVYHVSETRRKVT